MGSMRGVGLLALAGLSLGGCYRDSDDFNAKAAESMCRYNDKVPSDPFLDRTMPIEEGEDASLEPAWRDLGFQPYSGPYCEDAVVSNLSMCAASCEYSPRKARRCLRKLRRGVEKDRLNDTSLSVCDRVYECSSEVPAETVDACRITTQTCSVGGQPPPPFLALLLAVGLSARRRRRS